MFETLTPDNQTLLTGLPETLFPANTSLESDVQPSRAANVVTVQSLGGTMLTGAEARQAQFANLTANVPQPKGVFFVK